MNYRTDADYKAVADHIPVYCAHDKIVDIKELTPNPKNPNTHPDSQIELLADIIEQVGWRAPITVSTASGYVVKGHGRLMAAKHKGWQRVPVDYQNYASAAEEYADLVADNRIAELAEIDQAKLADIFEDIQLEDIPIELTGYTDEEVNEITSALSDAIDREAVLEDADEVPDIDEDEEAVSMRGDLWVLDGHRLICGDATSKQDVENLLGGGTSEDAYYRPAVQCIVCGKVKGCADDTE